MLISCNLAEPALIYSVIFALVRRSASVPPILPLPATPTSPPTPPPSFSPSTKLPLVFILSHLQFFHPLPPLLAVLLWSLNLRHSVLQVHPVLTFLPIC